MIISGWMRMVWSMAWFVQGRSSLGPHLLRTAVVEGHPRPPDVGVLAAKIYVVA